VTGGLYYIKPRPHYSPALPFPPVAPKHEKIRTEKQARKDPPDSPAPRRSYYLQAIKSRQHYLYN